MARDRRNPRFAPGRVDAGEVPRLPSAHPVARLQRRRSAPTRPPPRTPVTAPRHPAPAPSPADRRRARRARDPGHRGPPATCQPGRRDHRRHQALRRRHRRRPHEPAHRPRRVLQPPRPVRLRQDHDAPDDRRLRAADRGRDPARRTADRRRPAVPAQRQHGLPALRAVPAHGRRPERRLRPAPDARSASPRRPAASARR